MPSVNGEIELNAGKHLDFAKHNCLRCEALAVQPRGTRGESGGQTGWNWSRFCLLDFLKSLLNLVRIVHSFRHHLRHLEQAQAWLQRGPAGSDHDRWGRIDPDCWSMALT